MRRALIALVLLVACGDPVHDRAVDALGPEAPGVERGPYHRPGQPCLTCHGGDGPASFEMSFGGTIYAYQLGNTPATGASIIVLDAQSRTYKTTANCVGNFWIPLREFDPVFPVTSAVTSGMRSQVMITYMHRAGSCADCHISPEGPSSPGHVWVLPDTDQAPAAICN